MTTNKSSPTSASADKYRLPVASLNSLAITLAMVYEGANKEALISLRLPITIVMAIVSPNARPKPRMVAPTKPERA